MRVLWPPELAGNVEAVAGRAEAAREALWKLPTSALLDVLDALGERLLLHPAVRGLDGLAYLRLWLKRANLEELIALGLGGSDVLDGFRAVGERRLLAAQPRGIVVHWLAGNVATLGLFSLVQAWLTRNASIVKVPSSAGPFLTAAMEILAGIEVAGDGGAVAGRTLTDVVALVSFDSADEETGRSLSQVADVKVVWGGSQAVGAILALPQKETAEAVVFGPKYSLSVYDRESVAGDGLDALLRRTATDVFTFDQLGCSAPHVLFVERGGPPLRTVAERLSSVFRQMSARWPRGDLDPGAAIEIHAVRARHALSPDLDVLAPQACDWTILVGGELRLEEPVFHRTLFLKEVNRLEIVPSLLTPRVQTIGVAIVDEARRLRFCREATYRGAARCVPPGTMNNFDAPWDGLFFLDRLVRWVSVKTGER